MSRQDHPRDDSIEARAHRRVRRKLGFYWHALIFVLVNGGLWAMHLFTGHPRGPVILWGWGLGLVIQNTSGLAGPGKIAPPNPSRRYTCFRCAHFRPLASAASVSLRRRSRVSGSFAVVSHTRYSR